MRKIFIISLVLQLVITSNFSAQSGDVWMHPNAGQWDSKILHKIDLKSGWMYLEQGRFVYHMTNLGDFYGHKHAEKVHEGHEHEEKAKKDDSVKWHVVQQTFLGANTNVQTIVNKKSSWYINYFLGKDKSKWKSDQYAAQEVIYPSFYAGIDLKVETNHQVKYSFYVQPNVDPSKIKYKYIGSDKVWIDKIGKLHMLATLGEVIEEAPTAWTLNTENKKTKVEVKFKIVNGVVHFDLGSYNPNETLVIDPFLSFSTFSGSTADNWGYTATPGTDGSLFAGGIVFGAGYPISVGAYQSSFAGGDIGTTSGIYNFSIDIGITKFNSTGTSRLYSTLLGGNGNETPNSIVCNAQNELYIMGATSSTNFPVSATGYDQTKNGGFDIEGDNISGNEINFNDGIDIFVSKLSAGGNALLASTYIGGSGNDGMNLSSVLAFNYGDPFRGEIIVDQNSNVFVTSTTNSSDFPIMSNASSHGGGYDAVMFKFNSNLSTLIWSSYFGSFSDDTGNSIQLNSAGIPYVCGGTTSGGTFLNFTGQQSAYSGIGDGYVIKLDPLTGVMTNGSYLGTFGYDQAYFVQIDLADDVYVLGQTEGNMTITPGKYGNANSGQFIRKLNSNLTTAIYTTLLGNGSGNAAISPTAFLVSNCGEIYISGWGGTTNAGNSRAVNSTSNGFPTTSDAFQTNTNGSNFWVAVLGINATTLKYATYMGGASSAVNHVDGGTSRFDKNGTIYHAVCAACGGQNFGFTTTPGVAAGQNLSTNCNLAAWKFELSVLQAVAIAPTTTICVPDVVFFENNSSEGNTFLWTFGDGSSSTEMNPSHTYTNIGIVNVTLIVSDSANCFLPDTVSFPLTLNEFTGGVVTPPNPICPGGSFQMEAFGGTNYTWFPANFFDNPNVSMPTASVNATTTFGVAISNQCGLDTVFVDLLVYQLNTTIRQDTIICALDSIVDLYASGGISYQWTPPTTIDFPNQAFSLAKPLVSTEFICTITTIEGCITKDTTQVQVVFPPVSTLSENQLLCAGTSTNLVASGATEYFWFPNSFLNRDDSSTVVTSSPVDITYYLNSTNACGTRLDSVAIDVVTPNISATHDTIICPGEKANLGAFGGVTYSWQPAATVLNPNNQNSIVLPNGPTNYIVTGIDSNFCVDTAAVLIDLFPQPYVIAVEDQFPIYGEEVPLTAIGNLTGTYSWSPIDYLSCTDCANPISKAPFNINYYVNYTDQNGCKASDNVQITYEGFIYVPNTFTPDSDEFNNTFFALGGNIREFEMLLFNRWGELIWESKDINIGWDGTFNGVICQDGTYIWKLIYVDVSNNKKELVGHINLLR